MMNKPIIGVYHYFILLFLFFLSCTTPYTKNQGSRGRSITFKEPQINVLLAENIVSGNILLFGDFNLKSQEGKYQFNENSGALSLRKTADGFEISSNERVLRYQYGDKVVLFPLNEESKFSYNDISYSGLLQFISLDKEISLINTVKIEKYLAGVVPNEIPSSKQSSFNAIKAQAVAARTYAFKRMKFRENKYYHVYADHRDQVYYGILNNASLAAKAIEETKGEVLYYQGQPIDAVYHSTSGGITEDYASVWGDTSRPYLISKVDFVDEILCENSPYFNWQLGFTAKEIEKRLIAWIKAPPLSEESEDYYNDRPVELKILSRTKGKRVNQISIKSGENEIILNGTRIRQFFSRSDGRFLPSTLFKLSKVQDEFIFTGRGFGHGVGMSQYSAIRLSEKNYKYKQILGFYYPNTELIKLY